MNGALRPEIRAFLAFEIPQAVKEDLRREMAVLRHELPPARWVRAEGLHLTVKFLGASDPSRLEELTHELGPALTGLPPVTVTLEGSGFFPGPTRARVAWIGGTAGGIEPVVGAVERLASEAGWARERRRWSLHLTLARLRNPWPRVAADRFLRWGERLELESFSCRELILFSSELRPSGAVYARLAGIPLGA